MVAGLFFLAAEETSKGPQFQSTLLFIVAIFAIFWFLILRPQKKRERHRRELLAGVRKNDEVLTAGGIYGKVLDVKDDVIIVEVDSRNGLTLKMSKSSISKVLIPDQE